MKDTFGNNLKKTREIYGWTQEKTAKMLNVTRSAYGAWEEGRGFPSRTKIIDVSKLFQITDLIGFLENDQFAPAQQIPKAKVPPAAAKSELEKKYAAAGIRERLAVNILLGLVEMDD